MLKFCKLEIGFRSGHVAGPGGTHQLEIIILQSFRGFRQMVVLKFSENIVQVSTKMDQTSDLARPQIEYASSVWTKHNIVEKPTMCHQIL